MLKNHLASHYTLTLLLLSMCQHGVADIRYINLSPLIGQLPQINYPQTSLSEMKATSVARYTFEVATANYLSTGVDGSSAYKIDGETTLIQQTLELASEHGLFGISNRWFNHSAGTLDPLIYDFHDVFGMPQNGRSQETNDQFSWFIESNNQAIYSTNRTSSGFGDTSVFYEFNHIDSAPKIRLSLSLPSGSTSRRTSTDTWGLSASSAFDGPTLFSEQDYLPTLRTWLSTGALILYTEDDFGDLDLNPIVVAGSTGARYDATESLNFEVQIDTNTPYFNTEIRELGWAPIIASVAANYRFSSSNLQLGFNEDLRPSTSPDFTIFMAYSHDF